MCEACYLTGFLDLAFELPWAERRCPYNSTNRLNCAQGTSFC